MRVSWGFQKAPPLGVFEARPWLSQERFCPEAGVAEHTAPTEPRGLGLSLVSQQEAWRKQDQLQSEMTAEEGRA